MTDVNMDEPLPAIQVDADNMGVPSLAFGYDEWRHMTLAQLVQALAALTGEQLGAIVCVLSDERKQALAAAIDWPDEREEYERSRKRLYAQAVEEKARADRAKFWCERLRQALLGVQDAMRGRFPTPHLDSILAEYEESKNG